MIQLLKNQKGIAMLVALSAVLIMTFIAVEVGYNTQLEHAVTVANLERLQAYYLAKAGVNISLLRIKIFKIVSQKLASSIGKDAQLLDLVWNMPFLWPPQALSDLSAVDKEALKKSIKESLIQGEFTATIEAESGKIDLTDLVSPAKALQEAAQNQLVSLIETRLEEDDEWAKENRGQIRPKEIVNNIADWMSTETSSRNGGDKQSGYNSPLKTSNRPFKTLQELHMVKGMTDELYNALVDKVTLYGSKSINVNKASKDIIKSIDTQLTEKVVTAIMERRGDPDKGPFSSADDFQKFLQTQGVNLQNFNKNPTIPLSFEPEFNFRIKSTGIKGKSVREIFAITFDFDKVKEKLVTAIPEPTPTATPSPTPGAVQNPGAAASPTPTATPSPTPTSKPQPLPTGAPTVVHWQET